MCIDPFSIGLTAASVLARNKANSAVYDAQKKKSDAQARRNAGYQAEADTVMNQELLPGFTRETQEQVLGDAQARRLAESESMAGGGYDLATAGSSSADYQSELAKLISDKVKEGRSQAEAATKIGGYQDLAFNNSYLMNDSGMKMGQIGTNSQADSAILPYELEAAKSKGAGWSMLGDVFGGLGSIYSLGGLAGGGSGGLGSMFASKTAAPIFEKSVGAGMKAPFLTRA